MWTVDDDEGGAHSLRTPSSEGVRALGHTKRPARPDEVCSCGLAATVVHLTEQFGEVPGCQG